MQPVTYARNQNVRGDALMQASTTADISSQDSHKRQHDDNGHVWQDFMDPAAVEQSRIHEEMCHDEERPVLAAESGCPSQPEEPERVSTAALRILHALKQYAIRPFQRARDIMAYAYQSRSEDVGLIVVVVALLLYMLQFAII